MEYYYVTVLVNYHRLMGVLVSGSSQSDCESRAMGAICSRYGKYDSELVDATESLTEREYTDFSKDSDMWGMELQAII